MPPRRKATRPGRTRSARPGRCSHETPNRARYDARAAHSPRRGRLVVIFGAGGQCRRPLERGRRGRDLGPDAAEHRSAPPGEQHSARSDGARGDLRRGRGVDGGLEPFATRVSAPPGASADAAVAQAARDVLVARMPLSGADRPERVRRVHGELFRPARRRTRGKAVGAAAAAGMLAWRIGDHFDDAVQYVQPAPGPGCLRAHRPDAAGRREARRTSRRSLTPVLRTSPSPYALTASATRLTSPS